MTFLIEVICAISENVISGRKMRFLFTFWTSNDERCIFLLEKDYVLPDGSFSFEEIVILCSARQSRALNMGLFEFHAKKL